MGTILRTADSINLKQILVSKGTADQYNPKVVRSTMGAIFRVKIIECEDLVKTLKELKKHKIEIYATDLKTDKSIYDVNYKKKAVVIGNEANGVSTEILNLADTKIKIPMLRKDRKFKCSSCNRSYIIWNSKTKRDEELDFFIFFGVDKEALLTLFLENM